MDENNHTAYAQKRSWEGVEIETLLDGQMQRKPQIGMSFLLKPNDVAALSLGSMPILKIISVWLL